MNQRYDVCIIGGGAAGLAAAASIDRRIRTCIIEKNQILGRKILATGGGRCNLTNAGCEGVSATLDFFALQGLETYCDEEGRYYNVVPRGYYGDVSYDSTMKETDETEVTTMVYEQLRAFKRVAEKLNLTKEDIEDVMKNNALRLIESVKYSIKKPRLKPRL